MAKNNKPILSVLVDEEKKERFSALAKENNYSMGWLLNQAIDKMLEASSIHIYRESIAPTPFHITQPHDIEELIRKHVGEAVTDRATEIARGEVERATAPLFDDLLNLQSQLAEVKADCDLTTEGMQRLIADAIAKVSNPAAEPKKPSAPVEGIPITDFAREHQLDIKKSTSASDVNKALVANGLDTRFRYNSRNRRFIPLGAK